MPATIVIDLEPNIAHLGPFLITWHGVFAVLGIIAAARMGLWLLGKNGVDTSHGSDGHEHRKASSVGLMELTSEHRRMAWAPLAAAGPWGAGRTGTRPAPSFRRR